MILYKQHRETCQSVHGSQTKQSQQKDEVQQENQREQSNIQHTWRLIAVIIPATFSIISIYNKCHLIALSIALSPARSVITGNQWVCYT